MIHTFTVDEVMHRGIELPPAVVLGAGNTLSSGIAEGSRVNASAAATIIQAGLVPRDFVITTGLGPDTEAAYEESEAFGMAKVIWEQAGSDVHIEMDEIAHDTIENVAGVKRILQGFSVGALSVFGAVHHTTRFRRIASLHMEGVAITEVHTIPKVSTKARVREIGQDMLYRGVTVGMKPNDPRLEGREALYRKIVAPAKKIIMNSGNTSRYSSAVEETA